MGFKTRPGCDTRTDESEAMMLRFIGLVLGLALLASPAQAQNTTGLVVAACGTVTNAFKAGNPGPFTVDVTGKLCMGETATGLVPTNRSALITTGNTYQTVVPAGSYKSIQIENNNTNTDQCLVEDTGAVVAGNTTATVVTTPNGATTAAKASATLAINGSYTQSATTTTTAIVVTCTTTGDSVWVRTQ